MTSSYLECELLDSKLPEALADVKEDPADIVFGEVGVAGVKRGQPVDQVRIQLKRAEVLQQLEKINQRHVIQRLAEEPRAN